MPEELTSEKRAELEAYYNKLEAFLFDFNRQTDNQWFYYIEAIEMYCETTLTLPQIAKLLKISETQIFNWCKDHDWEATRKLLYPQITPEEMNRIKEKTKQLVLKYSEDVGEQLAIVGNALMEQAYELAKNTKGMEAKDVLNLAGKFKELHAKVTGQMKLANTEVTINNNTVYTRMVNDGIDNAFSAEVVANTTEVIEAPKPRALPEHVSKDIPRFKEEFTKLSDAEVDEMLKNPYA